MSASGSARARLRERSSTSLISLPSILIITPVSRSVRFACDAPYADVYLTSFCRTLVNAFAEAGLGVSVATDGVVYETDVLAAADRS